MLKEVKIGDIELNIVAKKDSELYRARIDSDEETLNKFIDRISSGKKLEEIVKMTMDQKTKELFLKII